MAKPPLHIRLASPRGFCAGVDRAIQIVERALELHGPPVYVRHEIVHNRFVVEDLERRGAVFVDELSDVPADAVVVFSAHGVPKSVPAEARARELTYHDATCPLVGKVHREAERHHAAGREIILIGHDGHPEVVGTTGQLPAGSIFLVETVEDAEAVAPTNPDNLAYITQTTLSVDETADIIDVLRHRFPEILAPRSDDICYATTNRQAAVKAIAGDCDVILVIGAPNSSNSLRLAETARRAGCEATYLVQRAHDIDWTAIGPIRRLGITAGASAPEILVNEVLDACRDRFSVTIEEVAGARESISFKLPAALAV
jgi:4-hydroxy-3-methylbut-2-enyl diphosphate reductase